MPGRVQIVLPGLFDLPLAELPPRFVEQRLPRLNHLLRFATPLPNRAYTIDAIIHETFAWEQRKPAALPLARAFAGADARDHLLAQPVYLHPDLNNAIIVPLETGPRKLADIETLIEELGGRFREDCGFTAVAEGLYLLRLETLHAPNHYPHILSVLGKPANPYFEQTREHLDWYRLLNEMQMFLHQHPVNRRRIEQSLLPINSLWCWGGGEWREVTARPDWYCDDPVLNRFAGALGLEPSGLGAIGRARSARDAVVVDLRLLEATKSGRAAALDRLLLDIERDIFDALADAGQVSLRLRAGFEFDFRLHPAHRWRLWRARRNLTDWQTGF